MTREQFDKLEVLEQIKYINRKLEDNSSITSVCKDLNISRSTIRDRFKKLDYSYSKDLNRYVHNDSVTDVVQKVTVENNKSISDVTHKGNNVSNTDVARVDKVIDTINKSDVEIKETIIDIVNNYDILKEIIELHKCNTSVIKQQIVIDVEESESKLTTLRVNRKELELFNKFCDANKQYKKIDLISQALKEFRERYK
ncbi:hypothetical protein [Romboutsia ilealis]|uniref:hypothetical protein n=1 Tax=Romboutsia ilealis TaxID=1115758 RepID=UPI002493F31D|nr:hypothetical protein [Romboutsia ilealis]